MSSCTCPYCEQTFDDEQADMSDLFRERNEIAAALGPAWKLVNEYCDAFRVDAKGRINLKKRVRILREVQTLWCGCVFELDGKRYKTDQRLIREAIQQVCNLEKTGFQNHNYLKKVLLATAQRVSTEGMTAKEETERHSSRRDAGPAEKGEEKISLEEALRRRGLEAGGLLKGMS